MVLCIYCHCSHCCPLFYNCFCGVCCCCVDIGTCAAHDLVIHTCLASPRSSLDAREIHGNSDNGSFIVSRSHQSSFASAMSSHTIYVKHSRARCPHPSTTWTIPLSFNASIVRGPGPASDVEFRHAFKYLCWSSRRHRACSHLQQRQSRLPLP